MDTTEEAQLLTHLSGAGPRGRARRFLFAAAAEEKTVLRRGRLLALYGLADIRNAASSPALRMPVPAFPAKAMTAHGSFINHFTGTLPFAGPTEHARLRGLLTGHFTAQAIAGQRAEVDRAISALLHSAQARSDTIDLVADLAERLPSRTMSALIGAPSTDWDFLDRFGNAMLAVLTSTFRPDTHSVPAPISEEEFLAGASYLAELVSRPGLPEHSIAAALHADLGAGAASLEDAVGLLVLLYMTGVDTVAAAVATAALTLWECPETVEQIRRQPDLADGFADEALRLDPPLHYAVRQVAESTSVAGHRLQGGDQVILCYAAANLDPVRYPHPLQFQATGRKPALSFGHGAHRCLGAPFAHLQVAAAVRALAGTGLTHPLSDIRWRPDAGLHMPASLPMAVAGTPREVAA